MIKIEAKRRSDAMKSNTLKLGLIALVTVAALLAACGNETVGNNGSMDAAETSQAAQSEQQSPQEVSSSLFVSSSASDAPIDLWAYQQARWVSLFGECTSDNDGEIKQEQEGTLLSVICANGVWAVANGEYDTYGWGKDDDGAIRGGNVTCHTSRLLCFYYKYDEQWNQWAYIDEKDTTVGVGCTAKRVGEVVGPFESMYDTSYYICHSYDDTMGVRDKHSSYYWNIASENEYNTYPKPCNGQHIGDLTNGSVDIEEQYYCSVEGWVNMEGWSWLVSKVARLNPNVDYGTFVDLRDSQAYKTTTIGEQIWMAENLNYADSVITQSLLGGNSKCWHDEYDSLLKDLSFACSVTGRLYNGLAVDDVCPPGWHLPSSAEWQTLINYVGGTSSAAGNLKSRTGWGRGQWSGNGTDAVGFSALPAGTCLRARVCNYYGCSNECFYNGVNGAWFAGTTFWTSSDSLVSFGDASSAAKFGSYMRSDSSYYSVRCLKD